MATATPDSPDRTRTPVRLAASVVLWAGLVASAVELVIALGTYGRAGSYLSTPFGEVAGFVFSVSLLATGGLLRARVSGNSLGWLFLAFGAVSTIAAGAWTIMLVEYLPGGDQHLGAVVSVIGAALALITWPYLIVALTIRFPSGRATTMAEARILRWSPAWCVVFGLAAAVRPGPILAFSAFDSPLPIEPGLRPILTVTSNVAALGILVPVFAAAIAMIQRYRRATSVERLQLRWFAFGASGVLVAGTLYVVGALVAADSAFVREGTYALMVASLTGLPIAVFQAIASHRLYQIDRIIGRAFAYGALTAILAGLYSASIRLFNWAFVSVTGEGSEAALVLTTLVLATTFAPIKTRLEQWAAKRFKAAPEAQAATSAAAIGADAARLDALANGIEARLAERLDQRMDAAVRLAVQDALAERASEP